MGNEFHRPATEGCASCVFPLAFKISTETAAAYSSKTTENYSVHQRRRDIKRQFSMILQHSTRRKHENFGSSEIIYNAYHIIMKTVRV